MLASLYVGKALLKQNLKQNTMKKFNPLLILALVLMSLTISVSNAKDEVYCTDVFGDTIYTNGTTFYKKHKLKRFPGDDKEVIITVTNPQCW